MGVTPALQDFAIVIGVTYPSGTLSGLRGTLNDAAAFTEWLRSPDGGNVPKDNIELALSPKKAQSSHRNAKPIQEQIDDALESLGVSRSKKPVGRRLYFYFTGHGFGQRPLDVCMLMAHATKNHLNRNIGLQEYRDFFQEHFYFQEVVFILDCCRDQASPLTRSAPQLPTWTLDADDPRPSVSDLVILAAPNGQKAHETVDKTGKPRGLFTLALLDVLSGSLGVDASNLKDNLNARMQALTAANGGPIADQRATVDFSDNRSERLVLHTAEVAPMDKVAVRIIAPKDAKGKLVVFDGAAKEIARQTAAKAARDDAPWLVDLVPASPYSVLHQKSASVDPLVAVIDWAQLEATRKDGHYVFIFPDA